MPNISLLLLIGAIVVVSVTPDNQQIILVRQGSNFNLTCSDQNINKSKHEYLLLWKGDDLVARSNMKDVSALGFKVVLNDTDIAATKEVAQYRDAGEYTCVHQDNTRELRLRTTQVIVYGDPEISLEGDLVRCITKLAAPWKTPLLLEVRVTVNGKELLQTTEEPKRMKDIFMLNVVVRVQMNRHLITTMACSVEVEGSKTTMHAEKTVSHGHKATAGLEPKIYKAVVQNLDLMKPEAKVTQPPADHKVTHGTTQVYPGSSSSIKPTESTFPIIDKDGFATGIKEEETGHIRTILLATLLLTGLVVVVSCYCYWDKRKQKFIGPSKYQSEESQERGELI